MTIEVQICLFLILPFVVLNGCVLAWEMISSGVGDTWREMLIIISLLSTVVSALLWLINIVVMLVAYT